MLRPHRAGPCRLAGDLLTRALGFFRQNSTPLYPLSLLRKRSDPAYSVLGTEMRSFWTAVEDGAPCASKLVNVSRSPSGIRDRLSHIYINEKISPVRPIRRI